MLSMKTVLRVAREINALCRTWATTPDGLLVSVTKNGEALWGEVTAERSYDMIEEMQNLGYTTGDMIDGEVFLDQFLPTIQEVADYYEGNRPDRVRWDLYTLEDGTQVYLVNDGSTCWLAEPVELNAVLDSQISLAAFISEEPSISWYTELCEYVSHHEELIPAFEAEFGGRNWP